MLGLERVLSDKRPQLALGHRAPSAPGRRARRHADGVDRSRHSAIPSRSPKSPTRTSRTRTRTRTASTGRHDENGDLELDAGNDAIPADLDPGAVRRYRFRHPTASGKTIAAAGFVEAARTIGVLILTHRRLLVSQFNRELKDEGYGERIVAEITGSGSLPAAIRSPSRPTRGSRAMSAT